MSVRENDYGMSRSVNGNRNENERVRGVVRQSDRDDGVVERDCANGSDFVE